MTDSSNMIMPVAPTGGMNGFGGFGGDNGWWIILLFVLLGGFGNGFGGYGNGAAPFVDSTVQRGFDQSALVSGINSINSAVTNGFAQAEIAANSRQMAEMNQAFALQSALQNCCCENRAATADLKYTVATENCADRAAVADGIRDVIAATQAQTQAILNQLCNDKLESKNETIAQLRSELLYARGQASQDVQTAAIQAGQRALANEVEQYVAPKAVPAYVVQNPNCCTNTCGCGTF